MKLTPHAGIASAEAWHGLAGQADADADSDAEEVIGPVVGVGVTVADTDTEVLAGTVVVGAAEVVGDELTGTDELVGVAEAGVAVARHEQIAAASLEAARPVATPHASNTQP